MLKRFVPIDRDVIQHMRRAYVPLARGAIFIVYTWFGALKLFGVSPANPLVQTLQERTIPWFTFPSFILFFGALECAIGISFLFPKATRLSIFLLFIHLVTTAMPLFLLPAMAWQAPFVPTLEGQYIIKNVLIVAAALAIGAHERMPRVVKGRG